MKKLICTLLTLTLLLTFFGCDKKGNYIDDASTETLGNSAVAALAKEQSYTVAQDGYLDDFFGTPAYVSEYRIVMSENGNDINEIGIYHVSEGNAEAMKNVLSKYLVDSLQAYEDWYNSYIPQELPKLVDAEVKVFGNYVVYAILSEADRTAAFDAIENELLEK